MAAQKPSSIGETNRIAVIFCAVAFGLVSKEDIREATRLDGQADRFRVAGLQSEITRRQSTRRLGVGPLRTFLSGVADSFLQLSLPEHHRERR